MIFRPELAKLVLQQRKSQTRRIADGPVCRYEVGKSYAVQPGRGKKAVCRITVTDVHLERLGAISLKDARREGFRTTGEFFDYWRGLHRTVNESLPVWVISFVLGDHSETDRFLDRRVHRTYTTRPPEAVVDNSVEGAVRALSASELRQLAGANRRRFEREHRDELRRRQAKSLQARLKDAVARGDAGAVRLLRDELDRLADQLEAA